MRTPVSKLLLAVSLITSLISCQKEVNYATGTTANGGTGGTGGPSTNDIQGDYDFVGMVARTQSTVIVNTQGQQLKVVTISNYTTKNNTGFVKITSNQLISNNLGYSIDTMMRVKTYIDNTVIDDSDIPFVTSVAGSNSTSPYVRNSVDSITVSGALGAAPDPAGNVPTGPVGAKLSWSGDTLLLKIKTTFTQSITQGGTPGTLTGSVDGVTKLKKR